MKNITKSLIALFAILAISCSDDVEDRPVITPEGAPVLLAPEGNNSYVLAIENAASQVERFVWTPADFGLATGVNYTVEIDAEGNEFASPQSLGTSVVNGTQLSVSVETLNGAVILAGGEPFVAGDYEVRVKAFVNETFEPMYSNVATITVTPYVAVIPKLFLVGHPQTAYGLNEWSPETAMEMRYIGSGTDKIYEAYVKIGAGQGFKLIGNQGAWADVVGNYGTDGGNQNGKLIDSAASSDILAANSDGDGLYYIWADLTDPDDMQYKAIKMNWGIIGDATPGGWGGETPMTYNFATNKFTISTALVAGPMKFRAVNASQAAYQTDWKFNIANTDPKTAYDTGGPDFQIAAGSYDIEVQIGFDGIATVTGL